MDLQLVFDETGGRDWSRRRLGSDGSRKDRVVRGPAGRDELPSGAPRGLACGLPISLLLWAVTAFAVWALWLR